jgi:solute carrier family 25 carnitine/acylcarnitine transporter 20/29
LINMATDHSWERKAKDTASGFVGGAVQVLVGQPFDLVKVRLQTGQFKSIGEAVTKTLTNEGPLAFYKGTAAPLFGVGACVSVQFYAFHEAKRQILDRTKASGLTYPQFYLAGATAGLVNTIITSPVEQLRILLQTQKDGRYAGPLDAARKIFATQGLGGIYRGGVVTALRECQAYGVWFLTFEYLMAREMRHRKREEIPAWRLMLYGAIAGEMLWLASYPLDVVKSQVQGDSFGAQRRYRGAIDAARQTWATAGFRGFWRGIVPTLLRATPASASTFASVELTLRLLG